MATWKISEFDKLPKLKNPILIEGLPGIGNVGKIVVDFLIEELKAKKIKEFISYKFPHSVFVNEESLVELPKIELYYKRMKGQDLLLLSGDIQPIEEESCYEFCDIMLDILHKAGGKEIITLGGIGLAEVPKNPKIYCTANNKDIVKRYKKGTKIDDKLFGVVGPIVGVSGVLIGMAGLRKIDAIALLAETLGHPMFIGVAGSKEILKILDKKFSFKLDLDTLDREVEEAEKDILKKSEEFSNISKQLAIKKLSDKLDKETNYIG